MKRRALVILLAMLACLSTFAATAGGNGNLSIQGTLNARVELTLPAAFEGEIIDTAGYLNSWDIGTLTVNTNFKNWKFYLSSTNTGSLVLSDDPSEKIPYIIRLVRATDEEMVFDDTSLENPVLSAAQPRTPKAGIDYELYLEFSADDTSQWQNGVYGDTIYISVSTN